MIKKTCKPILIGTRKSPLALWQANQVNKKIKEGKLIKIQTTADKFINKPLSEIGGKSLFTKELDEALLNKKIDIAVHSLKDVPTVISNKIDLAYILPRSSISDVLISKNNITKLTDLPFGSKIGTSSPRRFSQIKNIRPDINIVTIRGNIQTRINKIKEKNLDAIILALAKFYHDIKFENIKKISFLFFPFLILIIPFIFVVIQPDLGTSLSIIILGVFILFIAGVRIWKFILGLIVTMVSIPVVLQFIKPYQRDRIVSFLNPESDPLGQGYQLIQSKIALGSGGATGKGFLEGTQSYLEYLPEKQTDFIFTLIGEEFGFLGTMFIIFTFVLLIAVCYFISIKCFHTFGRILALGVASNVFIYVFMNIAMVSGLMPVVGIPLPLISYGGSVMLSIMISMGLVLNVELNYNLKKLHNA